MEKPFDPFDEAHRERRKRRSSAEVTFQKKAFENAIDEVFKKALEAMGNPDYFRSNLLLQYAYDSYPFWDLLRMNLKKAILRLDYVLLVNEKEHNGRWQIWGCRTLVFRKKSAAVVGKEELIQLLK